MQQTKYYVFRFMKNNSYIVCGVLNTIEEANMLKVEMITKYKLKDFEISIFATI